MASFMNKTYDEEDGNTLFLMAEALVLLLSLLRILVVAVVLAVNILALRRRTHLIPSIQCECLQVYISDSVKLCSIVYITSWTPFLLYSLLNGRWLWIDEHIFCLIQNFITNAICLVLLALAALMACNKIHHSHHKAQRKWAACLTLAAWLLPQLAYFMIMTTLDYQDSHNKMDFDFMDDLLGTSSKPGTLGITYKIGFTICGQTLCRLALTQYVVQYVVIVLPISLVAIVAFLRYITSKCRRYHKLHEDSIFNLESPSKCQCSHSGESPALEIILGTNVLWLTLIRPCILFLWFQEHLFVDLGSHLVLTIAAVFAPILPNQLTTTRELKIDPTEPIKTGTQDAENRQPE